MKRPSDKLAESPRNFFLCNNITALREINLSFEPPSYLSLFTMPTHSHLGHDDSLRCSVVSQRTTTETHDPLSPFPFSRLPGEIRNRIYAKLLDFAQLDHDPVCMHWIFDLGLDRWAQSVSKVSHFQTSLFYVSRQVSHEALHIFYTLNNFVRLTLKAPERDMIYYPTQYNTKLNISTDSRRVAACTRHAMDLELSMDDSNAIQCQSMIPRGVFVTGLIPCLESYLLDDTWANSHTFKLDLINSYSYAPEVARDCLLEPMRKLAGIQKITIVPSAPIVPSSYADDLVQDLLWRTLNPRDWLQQLHEIREEASNLMQNCDPVAASFYFKRVIVMIDTTYELKGKVLLQAPLSFDAEVLQLALRCMLDLALVLVRCRVEFINVWNSVDIALRLSLGHPWRLCEDHNNRHVAKPRNSAEWYPPFLKAEAYFFRAKLLLAVREFTLAREDLKRAEELLPGDAGIKQQLADNGAKQDAIRGRRLKHALTENGTLLGTLVEKIVFASS